MPRSILELFSETAKNLENRTAVAGETDSLTFRELLGLSRRIGRWLLQKGLKGRIIAVAAPQSVYVPALYFGVAWAGGCYVPLDPDAPEEKRKKILADCCPPLVLAWSKEDAAVVKTDGVPTAVMEEEDLNCLSDQPLAESGVSEGSPLYLIYTSGSTGEPKGILKTHGAVLDFVKAYRQTFSFTENDVLGCQTPFFFDASAKDLYMMASAGCRMELIPKRLFTMPVRLIEYLNQRGTTILNWVPSALSVVSRLNTFRSIRPVTLRRVMFVGEVFQAKQLNRWREACPDVEFVNLYGSSEIAGVCCYFRIEGGPAGDSPVPIGKPLPNCTVCLVADGKVVSRPGVLGEIYISSGALAAGYFGNEEKTGQSFFTADFGDGKTRRWFKTGDLARYDENGNLVFSSRSDFQIKHMGHRIELGEIEAAASSLPGVTSACCLYQKERDAICLFWAGDQRDSAGVAAGLRRVLPGYMVPKKYFFLKKIPLTPSGKADRMALWKEYLS